MIKPLNLYEVEVFDLLSFLNKIKQLNIKIYRLKKINNYSYRFYSSIYCYNRLKSIAYNLKVIKQVGYLSIIINLFKYKTTILSLIVSICFYFSLSNKIWLINIKGDNYLLNDIINEELVNNKIYTGAKKLSVDEISNIQNKILFEKSDVIEYLSIESNGCSINVTFKEKRKEKEKTKYKSSLYASKDGIIKSFDILSGEKVVDINDYVKKGDLLVKDVITTDYNQQIYVGTYGSVYAYTWYYITLQSYVSDNIDEADVFNNAMLLAKEKLSINFSTKEYIYEENVLQFKVESNKLFMKIHFTCVENIAKENV